MKKKIWYYFFLPVPLLWVMFGHICYSSFNYKMQGPGGGGEGILLILIMLFSFGFCLIWTSIAFFARPKPIVATFISKEFFVFYGIVCLLYCFLIFRKEINQYYEYVLMQVNNLDGENDPALDGLEPQLKKMITLDKLINSDGKEGTVLNVRESSKTIDRQERSGTVRDQISEIPNSTDQNHKFLNEKDKIINTEHKHIEIKKGDLNSQHLDLTILTDARLVPYFRNGKVVGSRLFAIKKDGIFSKMALANGDIVEQANDLQFQHERSFNDFFELLIKKGESSLTIERANKLIIFHYKLK